MTERWVSFISGEGTTMEAGIAAVRNEEVSDLKAACVVSSSYDIGGIRKASDQLVPVVVVRREDFRDESGKINLKKYGRQLLSILKEYEATLITLNGWRYLIPENVIEEYEGRIFNQHPGSVPEFGGKGMYGIRVHAARLNFLRAVGRDFWTEAVIQKVDKKFDEGAVVKSKKIEILPDDTPESLQKRVLSVEHELFVGFLKDFASGNIREIERRSLVLSGEEHILFKAKEDAIKAYPKI